MLLTPATFIATLAVLAAAAPQYAGTAIPISKRNHGLANLDGSVNVRALNAHIASAVAKIRRGIDTIEGNTGSMRLTATNGVQKRDPVIVGEPLEDVVGELWYGTISIGSPPQPLTVAFATASSDLIVPLTTCDSTCDGHTLFDSGSSSTAQDLGQSFNIKYGDGSASSGELYSDTVTIAGISATAQMLGGAKTYSTNLQSHYFPPDGVMGLGYPSLSAYNGTPVMQTLVAQGQTKLQFSVKLSDAGGELMIGGTNPGLYTGDFSYADVTNQGYWEVYMDLIVGNGQRLGNHIDVIIDTGTTAIIGIASDVEWLYNNLQVDGTGATNYGGGYYTFSCDVFPYVAISFYFDNTAFPIPASALNLGPMEPGSSQCLSGIVASQDPNAQFWIIGDVFLQGVYTTFDLWNNRVGFATLA